MQHVRPVDRLIVAVCHTRPARAGPCQAGDGDLPLSSHGDDLLAAPDGDGTGAGGEAAITAGITRCTMKHFAQICQETGKE
jgi:hypothetical protein